MSPAIDYQPLDWGSVVQRRASKEPIDKGGWNVFFTYGGGTGNVSPASLTVIRTDPATAWFGWPNDPKMEALRLAWYDRSELQNIPEGIPQFYRVYRAA
jgi:peptide/nickel transport system substrate-binding protein